MRVHVCEKKERETQKKIIVSRGSREDEVMIVSRICHMIPSLMGRGGRGERVCCVWESDNDASRAICTLLMEARKTRVIL